MKTWIWFSVFLILVGCYLWMAAPSITMGDSGELAAVGATLGVGHSPGYPLYSILGRLAVAGLPFGSGAFRMTLFSLITTCGAAVIMGMLIAELSESMLAGVLMAVLTGVSSLWLSQGITTEVFGLNSLVAALLLYACWRQQYLVGCLPKPKE